MRLAVISDIHANWDALDEVLRDIDALQIDAIVDLGDNIGYGPEPNRVIQTLMERNLPSVLGNHELAVVNPKYLNWFNPIAKASLLKTIEMLTDESRRYIYGLKTHLLRYGCRFVHGFPPDSPTLYHFEIPAPEKIRILKKIKQRICFIGHTHDVNLISFDGSQLTHQALEKGTTVLAPNCRYIISSGSVGQPRDGNNNAKYIIWDEAAEKIEVRHVPYDIAKTAAKIIAAGLPKVHADRLF